jgi:hypothetical protein
VLIAPITTAQQLQSTQRRFAIGATCEIMDKYWELARDIALWDSKNDKRSSLHGAVGIRSDGVVIRSRNEAQQVAHVGDSFKRLGLAHAEQRCIRKTGSHGTLYVVRVLKRDGKFAYSRPCVMCRAVLKARNTIEVFYSIDEYFYGVWNPMTDQDRRCKL